MRSYLTMPTNGLTTAKQMPIVKTISELKILDPAVGSGAFPMGMLHKLTLATYADLTQTTPRWEELQKQLAGKRATEAFNTQNQQETRCRTPPKISGTLLNVNRDFRLRTEVVPDSKQHLRCRHPIRSMSNR